MAFDPDQYLAEKTKEGAFDPDAYLKSKAAPEEPGLLKSAALGAMSGIPGAETVVSGLRSIDPNTTYEQAHQGLESAKDAAWNAHPTAYGAGKGAGMLGTGAVAALTAPASIPGAIAAGAVTGALGGSDVAERPADILSDSAQGAVKGAALSGIVGVAGSALSKALPAVGKAAVSMLGRETTPADISAYLKNPEAINNAPGKEALSEDFAGTLGKLGDKTEQMSADARNLLNKDSFPLSADVSENTLRKPSIISSGIDGTEDAASGAPTTINSGSTIEDGRINPATGLQEPGTGTSGKTVVTHGSNSIMGGSAPSDIGGATKTVVGGGSTNPILGVSGPTDADTLKPIFDQLKSRYLQNGVPQNSAAESAVNALDAQYQRLVDIAKANGGKLSEQDLKSQIVGLQSVAKNAFTTENGPAKADAIKNLSGALNGVLKDSNPAYGEAMKPVAEQTGLMSDVMKKFSLDTDENGKVVPTDATVGKVMNAIKEGKSESYDMIDHLHDLTGIDYLQKIQDSATNARFSAPGLGFGELGKLASKSVDGGQVAKSILNTYIKARGAVSSPALQKYGGILANAAKQGGNQLAATHFVLSTSDPEYQKLAAQQQDGAAQ